MRSKEKQVQQPIETSNSSVSCNVKLISLDLSQQSSIEEEAVRIVKDFLTEEWCLPTPGLILSIIGQNDFHMRTSYFKQEQFIEDLISTLRQTNAWILTEGTNSDMNEWIFKAIRRICFANDEKISSKIHCICLTNKCNFFSSSFIRMRESTTAGIGSATHQHVNIESSDITHSVTETQSNFHVLQLEQSITDDQLRHLRNSIEENASKENFNCPILHIVAGRDYYYLRALSQMSQDHWPVLVIDRSDERAFDSRQTDDSHEQSLENESNSTDADMHIPPQFYSIESNHPRLSEIILQTMYNWADFEIDETKRYLKRMKIAITWNDTRRMSSFDKIICQFNREDFHQALINAIFQNRVDFVEYLFQHGASIEEKFVATDMEKFWQIAEPNILPFQGPISPKKLSNDIRDKLYEDYKLAQYIESNPLRDLLIWSAFIDRPEMCKCLCFYTQEPVVAFLLVNKIYRKAKKRTYELPRRQEYMKKEKEFDRYAAELIDRCYKIDQKLAVDLLQTPSKMFFPETPLSLAESNQSRAFLATKTIWNYLDQIWYGDIREQGYSKLFINFLIFVSCLLVFLIPFPCVNDILSIQGDNYESKDRYGIEKIWHRYKRFYKGRVAVRFFYNIIVYIVFLGLYSYVLLASYFPLNINGGTSNGYSNILIPINEIIVHILTWCFMIEESDEIRQHFRDKGKASKRRTFQVYYTRNKWKILDFITYLTYLIGFTTRFFVIEDIFIISKIFMCINLFLWYVRILHIFSASERLGPKLLMIFNTLVDLVFYICFIFIFLFGYCVTSYALIITKKEVFWIPTSDGSSSRQFYLARGENNGTSLWSWNILRNALEWGMWKIYGEINLINFEQMDNSTISATSDAYGNAAFVFTIIFVGIANILLLNVLVALFNATVQRVQEQALQSWPYHRFVLFNEYRRKSMLPPPLSLIEYFYRFCLDYGKIFFKVEDDPLTTNPSFDVQRQSYIARKWREETRRTASLPISADDNNPPDSDVKDRIFYPSHSR